MEVADLIQELVNDIVLVQPDEDYMTQFAMLDNNYDKVSYVERYIMELNKIDEIAEKHVLRHPKDNIKSIELNKIGNIKYIEKKEYFEALELFNESICFATPGSWNLAVSYANRSAIMFDIKRFRECLMNIDLARKTMALPAALAKRLEQREASARLNFQKYGELQPYPFRLSYGESDRIKNMANCLHYAENEQWGRHVRSSVVIPPGKLLAMEEPFVSAVLPPSKYLRCANCLEEKFLTLIPCDSCTSVMYCSEKCLQEAYQIFHKYECPVIDLFQKIFYKTHIVAIRMVFKAININSNSIERFMRFCRIKGNLDQCIFSVNFAIHPHICLLKSVHGLVTHQDKRSPQSFFYYAVLCSLIRRFLFDYTPFGDVCYNDDKQNFYSDILFHYLQVSNCNTSDLHVTELKNNCREGDYYGAGMYPLRSMINHSCAPNVMGIFKGKKMLLYSLRTIMPQGQLFISYDIMYHKKEKAFRQSYLIAKYYFECNCEACENDYPMLYDFKRQFYVRSIM